MPYIDKNDRPDAWEGILKDSGALNYAIHQTINEYFEQNGRNYQTMNDVVGVLECARWSCIEGSSQTTKTSKSERMEIVDHMSTG